MQLENRNSVITKESSVEYKLNLRRLKEKKHVLLPGKQKSFTGILSPVKNAKKTEQSTSIRQLNIQVSPEDFMARNLSALRSIFREEKGFQIKNRGQVKVRQQNNYMI